METLAADNWTFSSLKEEEQEFNRLKVELHERLVCGLNLSLVRTVEPAWLREELRRGAEELAITTPDCSAGSIVND